MTAFHIQGVALYPNTDEAKKRLGAAKLSEYFIGDETAQFFLHFPSLGLFIYIDVEDITDET